MFDARRRAAFTLVEVLLVVVILAILAATVVPQFTQSSDDAKQSALGFNLHTLRAQIELYKMDHAGNPPPILNNIEALTETTDGTGTVGTGAGFPYGPYLVGGIPTNPLTGSNVVEAAATFPPAAASGNDSGWLYHAASGQIVPDHAAHLND